MTGLFTEEYNNIFMNNDNKNNNDKKIFEFMYLLKLDLADFAARYVIDGGENEKVFESFEEFGTIIQKELFHLFRYAIYNGNITATCYYFKKSLTVNNIYGHTKLEYTNVFVQGYINGNVTKSMIQKFVDNKLDHSYFLTEEFLKILCDYKDYDLLDYLIDTFDDFELSDVGKLIRNNQIAFVEKIINRAHDNNYRKKLLICMYEYRTMYKHCNKYGGTCENNSMHFIDMMIKLKFPVPDSLLEPICENKDIELVDCLKKHGIDIYHVNHKNIDQLIQFIQKTHFFEIIETVRFYYESNFDNELFVKVADILPPQVFVKLMKKNKASCNLGVFKTLPTNIVNNLAIYKEKYTRYLSKTLHTRPKKFVTFKENNKSIVDKYINCAVFSPSTFSGMCSKRQTIVLHLMMFFKHLSVGLNKIIPKPIIWIIINNMFFG